MPLRREIHQILWSLLVFVAVGFASLAPIRSYDYYWHLATGRYIVENRAIPVTDPFAIGSEKIPWINGSWLFDAGLFALQSTGGDALVVYARATLCALLFAMLTAWALRRAAPPYAVAVVLIAFVGASMRLGTRPETVALFLCAALLIVQLDAAPRTRVIATLLLTMLWANVHASALLAPILCGAFLVDNIITTRRIREPSVLTALLTTFAATVALFATPFGLDGVVAPLRLTAQVSSGAFVNSEWLPSVPRDVPALYFMIGLTALALYRSRVRSLALTILFALFTLLAIRYVRNTGFFFIVAAVVLAWHIPSRSGRRDRILLYAMIATIVAGLGVSRMREGVLPAADPAYFPLAAVQRLQSLDLDGNIYNADQFGGLLIWSFYPDRRVLTDGRNELYGALIAEIGATRRDSRRWKALLDRHHIALAVDEYRPPLEVDDRVSGTRRSMPASLAFYPPQQWALVAADGVAMVFARRSSFDAAQLSAIELRGPRPDAR